MISDVLAEAITEIKGYLNDPFYISYGGKGMYAGETRKKIV